MTATAHETAAVLRMHRAGMHESRIRKLLGMSKTQLMHELRIALEDETAAFELGQPIQDDPVNAKVDAAEKNAKDVEKGEFLIGHNFVESVILTPARYDSLNRQTEAARAEIRLIDGGFLSFGHYDKVRAYREPEKV